MTPIGSYGGLHLVPAAGGGREAVATASAEARLRNDWLTVASLDGVRRAREAMLRLGDALLFPEYVGRNWDAFHEAVRDLEWLPSRPRVLVVDSAAAVLAHDRDGWQTLVDLLLDAVVVHADSSTPLQVVVLL